MGPEPTPTTRPVTAVWLTGGGEMGDHMRSLDWSRTPLGPVTEWPQSLRSAVSILLPSKAQIVLFWGPDLIALYNDAYRPVFGTKHPAALGQPARECWREVWDVLKPLFEGVMRTGEAFWARDHLFYLERHGYAEETYFDVSYDPVRDETGGVGGVFCIVSETTGRVLGERRLRTLRELGAGPALESEEAVCVQAAAILGQNPGDVPFALLYLLDDSGRTARLVDVAGLSREAVAASHVDLTSAAPAAAALRAGSATEASPDLFVAARPPTASPDRVVVLPLLAGTHLSGFLVIGVSQHLALSGHYRDFLDLVADRVATALASVRAYGEQRKRADALTELDRAKTAFFSNVSHEFRTPLTLMLGPLEDVLALPDNRIPENRELLAVVHRNGLRLLRLVNTLLDFSRIEAGRVQVVYELTDLAKLTSDLASVFRSTVERGGLHLVVDCPPALAPVYVDREKWEKIVLNLLSNAFKFTFEGEIAVTLRSVGDGVELEVRDSGVGIPPDELPHVFERFHRVLGVRARTHEGTGIGLALVQELAKLHGGTVRATSEIGRGSAITVTIPYGAAHLPAERIGAARTLASTATGASPFVEEAERWVSDDVRTDTPRSTAASRVPHARILLADDNADMRDYLRRLLGQYWTVESVGDGQAALDAARARRPDLVLADVMMPRLDGLGLLRALRGDPATAGVPVVLLSARAGEESRVEGIEGGADDYLVKPFSARELIARVNTHLELARVRRAAQAEVQDAHERLEAALETGRMIAWDWDLTSGISSRSRTAPQLLGVPVQGEPRAFYDLVEPEDRPGVESRIAAAIADGTPYEAEFRVRMPGGETRWLGERGRVRRDNDGRPVRFVGVTFDFTERKQIEAALRDSEARLLADLAAMAKLQEVSTRLVQTSDPAALLLEIVDAAIAVTGADMGNIQLLDHASGRLRIVASRGFDRPFLEFFDTVQEGHAACGMAMQIHERVGVEDVVDSPLFRDSPALDVLRAAGVRAVQATPLFDRRGRVVGVLSTHYRAPRQLADRDRRLVDLLARQAADLIERANAEQSLLEADRAKDEFLAMLGHELRNPLGAISNAVAVLSKIGPQDEQLLQLRAIITRQAQQLTRLVDDLLDVSRLVAGKMDLRREPVNLEALARQCLSTVTPPERLRQRSLTLEAHPVWVEGDAARLEQVLTNLIDNALKYTPPGGRVSVTVRAEGPDAVIRVRDTGVGIASDLLPRIFDVFVQARQKPDRAMGGLGLGLALVKRLVEMQRGTVGVASDGPGRGAEFMVRLPLLAHVGDGSPAAPRESKRGLAPQRVLIVEDHVDSRASLRLLLEAAGHHVEEAADGRVGLARLEALRPDIAFVDVGLPEMDGYAVARAVRAAPPMKDIFLVALTGYGDPRHRREAAAAGFDAHLVKPVTLERLLQVLERASRREPRNAPTHATKVRPRRRIPDGA